MNRKTRKQMNRNIMKKKSKGRGKRDKGIDNKMKERKNSMKIKDTKFGEIKKQRKKEKEKDKKNRQEKSERKCRMKRRTKNR